MEGYVFEQDGKKWIRCWYMLAKDLALYKFRAHEVSQGQLVSQLTITLMKSVTYASQSITVSLSSRYT